MPTPWSYRYAQRAAASRASTIRELLKLTEDPAIISFAGGLPAGEAFPIAEIRAACDRVLAEQGAQALQYGATDGCAGLRAMIERHMRRYGIDVDAGNILPTSGSQQALDLIGKVFLDPGDRVVVERPTYLGALQAWRAYQAVFLEAGTDEDGMDPDSLPPLLRGGPKLVYALPNFQNPTGATLPLERRRELVQRAEHYGVPIVEDDPYGQLRYRGAHLPPLFALDAAARNGRRGAGNVIYLSSFSKTLAPGLRLGWIVAPREVIERLVLAKQGTDLHTSTLVQLLAHQVGRGGFLDRHVRRLRALYHSRCDAMLAALSRHFPPGVRWSRPQGGLFLWVTLPAALDAAEVLQAALAEKVAFVPGESFYAGEPERNTLRLNFSNAPEDRIEEGIRRLGRVLGKMRPCHNLRSN